MATSRPSSIGLNQRTIGKGVGILVGALGVLTSMAVLFVPVSWSVGSGASEQMAAVEYLFGNVTAESLFLRATFLLLVSVSIIHIVATRSVRVLWLIAGIVGVAGIGGLQYVGNTGKIIAVAAVLLTISAILLTFERHTNK